jgi:hypothetical protein
MVRGGELGSWFFWGLGEILLEGHRVYPFPAPLRITRETLGSGQQCRHRRTPS